MCRSMERERGYDEPRFVESFVILHAAGGDGVADGKRRREDAGLKEMIGQELPSAEAARQFRNALHPDEKIEEAPQRRLPDATAYSPEETRLGRTRWGEPGLGAAIGRALSPAGHRHGGSGRHDHGKPEASGLGDL